MIRVVDTGHGMDSATQARVFEPFFTTKEPGHGTGMGLAMVYGIVQQSGGEVRLTSDAGRGTMVEVLLPCVDAPLELTPSSDPAAPVPRGSETILLVEDEPGVRGVARRTLEGLGYRVVEARDGIEALALISSGGESWDLLVTDIVMPGLGGLELVRRARELRPQARVLLMSGFADDTPSTDELRPELLALLPKPFSGADLGRAVHEALTQPGPAQGGRLA